MTGFSGFSPEATTFLTTLGTKDKAWFDENRKTYDRHVVAPAKAFVEAMGAELHDRISPAIEASPKTNGSIAPINNDLRFSPDRAPYKDHLMFRFWEGPDKKTAPTLWIRFSPADGTGFATGAALPDLDRWRALVADDASGAELAEAVHELVDRTGAEVVGDDLKRVPKPYPADHPRGDLLRHKGLQIRWIEDANADLIGSSDFAPWCAERLEQASSVHRWLVEHLA